MTDKSKKKRESFLELAPTDRKMLSKSATEFEDSCEINASEKEGKDLNKFNKSVVPSKNEYNFDFGAPNKGTPQIDQVFQQMTRWELFKRNVWYYWDGIAFFSFNDTKLSRMRGKPASYLDKLGSINVCIRGSIISVIVAMIIY